MQCMVVLNAATAMTLRSCPRSTPSSTWTQLALYQYAGIPEGVQKHQTRRRKRRHVTDCGLRPFRNVCLIYASFPQDHPEKLETIWALANTLSSLRGRDQNSGRIRTRAIEPRYRPPGQRRVTVLFVKFVAGKLSRSEQGRAQTGGSNDVNLQSTEFDPCR